MAIAGGQLVPDVPQDTAPDLGEWPCMVCRRWRPDRFISVVKRPNSVQFDAETEKRMGGPLMCNVRYCNDDPYCSARATAEGPWAGSSVIDGDIVETDADAQAIPHRQQPALGST